jgi:dienelactone hydrolase
VPLSLSSRHKADPGFSEKEMKVIEKRAAEGNVCAMGLRFTGDPMVPAERFKTLKDRLGDNFEAIELDSSPGNAGGFGRMAHSVLTLEVRDVEGQQAYEARKRVMEFLKERLGS